MSALLGGHSFSLITDTCHSCGCDFQDWITGKEPACLPQTQTCCNKFGRDRWNSSLTRWECSQCGMTKSNDPHYRGRPPRVTATEALDKLNNWKPGKPVCDHRWKTYAGLKETFEFCEVCDLKR